MHKLNIKHGYIFTSSHVSLISPLNESVPRCRFHQGFMLYNTVDYIRKFLVGSVSRGKKLKITFRTCSIWKNGIQVWPLPINYHRRYEQKYWTLSFQNTNIPIGIIWFIAKNHSVICQNWREWTGQRGEKRWRESWRESERDRSALAMIVTRTYTSTHPTVQFNILMAGRQAGFYSSPIGKWERLTDKRKYRQRWTAQIHSRNHGITTTKNANNNKTSTFSL